MTACAGDTTRGGQVAREVYSRDGVDTVRSYQYSPRDQLVASTTGTDEIRYSYGDAGNPTQVVDSAGARDLARNGADLTVGSVEYHWDAAGRVDRKGPWMLAYGASGQLEVATRIGRVVQFSYDEEGERLLKRIDGTPVRANLGGGVLTADRFVEPVVVEGVVIGVLENGAFSSLLTDPRGTVVVDKNGARTLASPYGLRTVRPDVTEVVDFTKLGWDPDLDVVRMGVRDYDPNLAQFHTPDPAFLGDPDRCLASALECNLYSYAAGNPIAFTDPSGLGVRSWARKAASATWGAAQVVGQAVVDYGPQIAGAAVGAVVGCATAGPAGCVVGTRYGMVIGGALGAGFGYAAKSLVTGEGDVAGTIHAMTWGAASEMGGAIVGRVVGAVAAPAFRRLADWWAKQRASMDNLRSLMNVSMAGGPSGRPKIKVGRGAVTAPTAQPSKPMLGARGVQVTSKTMWQGSGGARIDLENPNPGQRAGQIHFQRHGDDIKYLYDPSSNRFFGAPEAVNDLLERPDVKKAIEKAMRYLGEST
jgi:RHS repeat-associated protein